MVGVDEVRDALTHSPFFAGFDAADLANLAAYADVHTYEAGTWLFHEGGPHEWFGVIVRGDVALVHDRRGRPMRFGIAGVGVALGEGALLDATPHLAGGYARTRVTVLRVSMVAVRELGGAYPALVAQIAARAGVRSATDGNQAAVSERR